jgi:hypothetical protein
VSGPPADPIASADLAAPPHAVGQKAPAEEPFILTALLSLLGASVWMALRPELLLQFFYSPELLALTHLVALGFITSLIMGVLLRLAPQALGVPPRSRRVAWVQFALHLVGWSGMVLHFHQGLWRGVAWATLVVWLGTLLQLWNFRGVLGLALRGHVVAAYVAAALVNLVLAASLGVSFGFLHAYGVGGAALSAPLLDRLAAHLHLAALGWITTMIFGIQLLLLPGAAGSRRAAWARWLALQLGLLGAVVSLLLGWDHPAPFAAAMLLGVLGHAAGPLLAATRQRGSRWERVALVLLVVLACTGTALAVGWPDAHDPLRLRVQFAYGYVALLGWTTITIASTAFRLFPVWVWEERFRAEQGLRPVPPVEALASRRLVDLSGLLLTVGVCGTAAAMLGERESLAAVSVWLVVGGVLALVVNFVRTARWALLPMRDRSQQSGSRAN